MNWRRGYQPKKKGGMGVTNVKLVNLSLLTKWKWKLFKEDGSLWKRVLEDKYGKGLGDFREPNGVVRHRLASLWWKDLTTLEDRSGLTWFKSEVVRRMRDGMSTSFWKDRWRSNIPFCDIFPRLFSISIQKDSSVGEVCSHSKGERR